MTSEAGILRLMDDLGRALASDTPPQAMFGGGAPAQIPAVNDLYKQSLEKTLQNADRVTAMLSNYDTPQGNAHFIATFVAFMNRHYHMEITEENVAITPGSQTGYYLLYNLLAGSTDGVKRKILFPLVPEYIGYVDQLIEPDCMTSYRPKIEKIGDHEFKYLIDFDQFEIRNDTAAIALSRPTNPTGNVVSDEDMKRLLSIATEKDIPIIVDNAYGLPFPGVVKPDITLPWNSRTVLSFSLSKVGLPSSRVGIFVGPVELMKALASANAIVSLASPSIGQYVADPLIADDSMLNICERDIKPFYFGRADKMRALMDKYFPVELPWRVHVYEGSYFFWLWLEGARLTGQEMYDKLKERGVIVVAGEHFFPGQDTSSWRHAQECMRLNFARPNHELEAGVKVLAEVIREAYS